MHTDQYKLNLRTLTEGDHEYSWLLEDRYFQSIDSNGITGGEVEVHLDLRRTGDVFSLAFSYDGVVDTTCDRCLDPLEVVVEADRELVVKFGQEYLEESDEILVVGEQDGVLDLEWLMYEDIVLSLPVQRLHEDGQCNDSMLQIIHSVEPAELIEGSEGEDITRDEDGIDERWAALKALKRD